MSDPLAHYAFLPWMRQGIGSKITEEDALGTNNGSARERAELTASLNVQSTNVSDGSTINTAVPKTLKLQGPPDVLGVSKRAIVRVEPKPKVNNYQANGLPYIEFYREDFLWAYTPAKADDGVEKGKLTPWLALICLKDDEFTLKNTSDGRPYITIESGSDAGGNPIIDNVFHDETQHWAWGHVHLNTEIAAAGAAGRVTVVNSSHETEVAGELDADPDTGLSRLLCPRKLIKETGYTAFLVPAFETGRLAGLGVDYTDVKAQKMSWENGGNYAGKTRGYDYPVYHQWVFRTGLHGDFESLARILKAVVTGPELGKRQMYIADPGYGLASTDPNSTTLGLEGALKPPGFVSDPWTNGTKDNAYRTQLRKLLNLSIDNEKKFTDNTSPNADSLALNPFYSSSLGDDPIVTPHIYGRWHGLVNRLKTSGSTNYAWVNDLNLDPRSRASAGLGVTVVQKNQNNYMRRAWKQVEEINEANKKIRKAALARMISHSIYTKHVKHAPKDQVARFTSPMHSMVLSGANTVENKITSSLVPNASKSAAFRKITRPGKKTNKAINKIATTAGKSLLHANVIKNFNDESITTAKDKAAPQLAISGVDITTAIDNSRTDFQGNDTAMATQAVFEALQSEADFSDLTTRKGALKTKIDNNGDLNNDQKNLAKDLFDGLQSSTAGDATTSHIVNFTEVPYKAIFGNDITAKTYLNIILTRDTGGAAGQIGRATTLSDLEAFEDAFKGFAVNPDSVISKLVAIPKGQVFPDVDAFAGGIAPVLKPKTLMKERLKRGVTVRVWNPLTKTYNSDPNALNRMKPVMAYPKIDDPMFRNLRDINQEYILPNIDKVPNNSITLLEVNQKFIEAYMGGLNHEMSRELLWREFPTDQRGTYFRQFWDVSDNVTETDQEKKYDIKKMPDWETALGTHSPRVLTNPSASPYLVLLIRGELLKKYPNTQVYAQKAEFKVPANPAAPRQLSDETVAANIKLPAFMAELDPDIYLFGFDLDKVEAHGYSDDASKPGWFFVLRERPGQINFGLDDYTPINPGDPLTPTPNPSDWNDLSWEHMTATANLSNYQLDAEKSFTASAGSANSPQATWGNNSADLAYILYQNPVIFARHAQEMLPPDTV